MDPRHGCNLLDILDALDSLDLWDDADVAVGRGDVELVVGVDGCVGDAGGEDPGGEGALADGRVVDLLDEVFDVLSGFDVGDDDS